MLGVVKTVLVADDERVLLFRDRQFERVLQPGRYRFLKPGSRFSFEVLKLNQVYLAHDQLELLLKKPEFARHVEVRRMQENEVGVVYVEGELHRVLEPGERLVTWKDVSNVDLRVFSLDKLAPIAEPLLSHLLRAGFERTARASRIVHAVVPDGQAGLLFENGRLVQTLAPGRYGYWAYNRDLQVQLYDLRLQMVDVAGQEILTRDRVSLRINLNAVYRLVDVEMVAARLKDAADFIYKRLQLALREVVGTRTLDELLADKNLVSEVIYNDSYETLKGYGIELDRVGVKDIILPGEMKEILNQVVQAQKAAEANLIKRREETAATRSLSNTAKMMEKNAVLMRLKELETLERVVERIDRISVYGGLDSVMNDLVRLTDDRPDRAS
ncbi:slipin family protein [Marinobacter zhejiangensis]|uniref:SPFH domain / Band 7 family protein n=1 Tax=Marinobacter zhejiangensis TaxID=488535 RepID=A0A1I4NV41_9GAMM|nr:slipin family protein [Marinobacter zhejiangensis]SFM19157.1 SPFH domain / Band 7 family protein [Marinobacter zhejiangensis]